METSALMRRIGELEGLWVRVHFRANPKVLFVDGLCRGVQDDYVVLDTSLATKNEPLCRIPLAQVTTVTQIPSPQEVSHV